MVLEGEKWCYSWRQIPYVMIACCPGGCWRDVTVTNYKYMYVYLLRMRARADVTSTWITQPRAHYHVYQLPAGFHITVHLHNLILNCEKMQSYAWVNLIISIVCYNVEYWCVIKPVSRGFLVCRYPIWAQWIAQVLPIQRILNQNTNSRWPLSVDWLIRFLYNNCDLYDHGGIIYR